MTEVPVGPPVTERPNLPLLLEAYIRIAGQYEDSKSDLCKELGVVLLTEIAHSVGQKLMMGRRSDQGLFYSEQGYDEADEKFHQEDNVIYPDIWEKMKNGSIDEEESSEEEGSQGDPDPSNPPVKPCDTE